MMNTMLNMNELMMITGGTGPISKNETLVGWPNGWDLPDKGSFGTCDPPRTNCVGPVNYPYGYPYGSPC